MNKYNQKYRVYLADCLPLLNESCKKEIIKFFLQYSNFEGGAFKKKYIANKTGYSLRRVSQVLTELKKEGILIYRSSLYAWALNDEFFIEKVEPYEVKNIKYYDFYINSKRDSKYEKRKITSDTRQSTSSSIRKLDVRKISYG